MKKVLIALCVCIALAFAACNRQTTHTDQDKDTQEVEQTGTPVDLLGLLSDSIAMDETRADLYLQRAQLYLSREQVGQAMADVSQAIQLDPNYMEAFLFLSDIYYLMGDEANITATLNRALEIDPYDSRPMVKLAELSLLQQNYNLAMGYVDKALKLNTFNPRAYFVKGMVYMAVQDTTAALRNFLISREQDGSFFDPQHEICNIYIAQNNPLAENFLRSMVTNFPEEPISRYELVLFLQYYILQYFFLLKNHLLLSL